MAYKEGNLLGRYQQYQVIGAKTTSNAMFTDLYDGYDLERQCPIAIYAVKEEFVKQVDAGLFVRTMERAQQLVDPNLLSIVDYGEDSSYIITEWLPGKSLHDVLDELRRQTLLPTPLQVIDLVQQIGCALESLLLNDQQLRTVNLHTIMLVRTARERSGNFRAILTDLGIAEFIVDATNQLNRGGAEYAYLAPEHFKIKNENPFHVKACESAIYALGAVLYTLFVGEPPLAAIQNWGEGVKIWGVNGAQAPSNKLGIPRPKPLRMIYPQLPVALERVILTALDQEPKQRYDRPRAMVAALSRVIPSLEQTDALLGAYRTDEFAPYLEVSGSRTDDVSTSLQPILTVTKTQLQVAPGIGDSTEVSVLNRSSERAERFRLQWECDEAILKREWVTIVTHNTGLANYNESAVFTFTIQPPAGALINAGKYPITIKALGSLNRWRVVDEQSISVVVQRVARSAFDEIWPREIPAYGTAQLTVRNQGNVRESFQVELRSDNSELAFDPEKLWTVLDPGREAALPFRSFPRRRRWFGRDRLVKLTAQVAMQQAAKLELATAQVRMRSLFPPLVLLLTALALVVALLVVVWSQRPVVNLAFVASSADECKNNWQQIQLQSTGYECISLPSSPIEGPALVVGWMLQEVKLSWLDQVLSLPRSWWGEPPKGSDPTGKTISSYVKSIELQLYPDQQPSVPITQTLPVKLTNNSTVTYVQTLEEATHLLYIYRNTEQIELVNNPRLIARNRLGEMTWLGPLSWLGIRSYRVFYTQIVPKPALKIAKFCVAPDDILLKQQCSTPGNISRLLTYATATKDLFFRWNLPSSASNPKLLLQTAVERIDLTSPPARLPAPTVMGQFPYTLILVDDKNQQIDELPLVVEVTALQCSLNLEAININNGLALQKSPGDDYETLGVLLPERPMTIILLSQPADYAQNFDAHRWVYITIKETQESGWVHFDGLDCPGVDATTAFAMSNVISGTATTITRELTSNNNLGSSEAALLTQLPITKPEFGATVTPTPTLTPPPTPLPVPTSTPEPLFIDISIDKTVVGPDECFSVKWTITGVKAVYFGRSDINKSFTDLIGTANNTNHIEPICNLKETTTFIWRIVIATEPTLVDTIQTREVKLK